MVKISMPHICGVRRVQVIFWIGIESTEKCRCHHSFPAARVPLDIRHQGKNEELRIVSGDQDDIADIGRVLEIHQFFQFADELFHDFTALLIKAGPV